MLDENEVYQYVYAKRDDILNSVTIYVLQFQFKAKFSLDELDDILDLLVEKGKLKTNGTRTGSGMRSFWVRRDPNQSTPKKDKGGFLTPNSPGHSMMLLNNYMRTDLLKFIHDKVRQRTNAHPKQSPLKQLVGAINDVLGSWKGSKLVESLNANPIHLNPYFEFDAEEDFNHDMMLMTFHLKELRCTLKKIKQDAL